MIPNHQLHTEAGARERIIPACVVKTTFVFRRRETGVTVNLQPNQWVLRTPVPLDLQTSRAVSHELLPPSIVSYREEEQRGSVLQLGHSLHVLSPSPGLLRPPVPGPGEQQAAQTPSTGPVQEGGGGDPDQRSVRTEPVQL